MFFDVKVHLPAGTSQNRLQVPNFETRLPNFAHILGDLGRTINFNRIALWGTNDRISAKVCRGSPVIRRNLNLLQSVFATSGTFKSSNAPIDGIYTATDALELLTTNGAINTNVTLADASSSLNMDTTNGFVRFIFYPNRLL